MYDIESGNLKIYLREIGKTPLLTREQEEALAERWSHLDGAGDTTAQEIHVDAFGERSQRTGLERDVRINPTAINQTRKQNVRHVTQARIIV